VGSPECKSVCSDVDANEDIIICDKSKSPIRVVEEGSKKEDSPSYDEKMLENREETFGDDDDE
jgi:hypothetical protein